MVLLSHSRSSEVANTYGNPNHHKTGVQWGITICGTHLDELVPAGRDDDGVLGVGREAHARDPLGVALVGDGVLAVAERVPELDGPVARAGDDLAVVGGERDGEDVVGVADKAAGGHTGGELPQAQGLVPRRGEGVGAVRGDDLCSLSAQRPRFLISLARQLLASIHITRTQSETMWEWPWRLLFG